MLLCQQRTQEHKQSCCVVYQPVLLGENNTAESSLLCVQRMQTPKLMPTEPALLHEAACWVDTWQEPNGHTNYEAALQLAERYLEADCLYIFSDGLSDYAVVLLEVLCYQD